jgi:16S rRNA processing protein RimM
MRTAPAPAAPADLVELGRVVSAYGVRGWVKIQPYSTQGNVLLGADSWWLKAPAAVHSAGALPCPRQAKVVQCRAHGSTIVARLDTLTDRTGAEAAKGSVVCMPRAAFPPCDPDEYYWVDLIGCQLWGERDGRPALIGRVADVIDNGAHALLRVVRADATDGVAGQGDATAATAVATDAVAKKNMRKRADTVLVPFVGAHVHTVDLANKRLDSNWPADF